MARRVGVLRGGPSSEYDVSLKSGAAVLKNLSPRWQGRDILITKDGAWHLNGLPFDPRHLYEEVDVVWNALHGEYGEDGQIQQFLDEQGVPYTGPDALAAARAMDKPTAKDFYRAQGLRTPAHLVITAADDPVAAARFIHSKMAPPWILKPTAKGSSVGVILVKYFINLADSINQAQQIADTVMAEEFITGKEATCGVVDGLRNEKYYSLFPIEIRRPAGTVFDYEAKYGGQTQEICPGYFTAEEKAELQRLAQVAHDCLGLRHYSRSDFIVGRRGIYILETNSLPGLTSESLLPKALTAHGITYPQFLDHILDLIFNH